MSDEEYDDELPPISVNSSTRESGGMAMPSAEELARGRAREAECERELQQLRAETDPALAAPDSSGSEGEAALAAAVTRLQMRAASRARPPALADVLQPMLARLPHTDALSDALRHVAAPLALTDAVIEAVLEGQVASEGSALSAAWLCAGSVAAPGRAARRRCRRALHKILSEPPFDDPDSEESCTLKAAVLDGVGDASTRLELADALAPAARAPLPALLQRRLLAAALADLLHCELDVSEDGCLCAWAAGAAGGSRARLAGGGGAAVRAAGRVARACTRPALHCAAERARLLHTLQAPAAAGTRTQPDRLEVLVGASKLQLLFRE